MGRISLVGFTVVVRLQQEVENLARQAKKWLKDFMDIYDILLGCFRYEKRSRYEHFSVKEFPSQASKAEMDQFRLISSSAGFWSISH